MDTNKEDRKWMEEKDDDQSELINNRKMEYRMDDVRINLMSPTKHFRRGEDGNLVFKNCIDCIRPTVGHDDRTYKDDGGCYFEDRIGDEEARFMYEEIRSKEMIGEVISKLNVDNRKLCEECSMEFASWEDLEEHLEGNHDFKNRLTCKMCNETFISRQKLETHNNHRHYYICPDCDMFCGGRKEFHRHRGSCDDGGLGKRVDDR